MQMYLRQDVAGVSRETAHALCVREKERERARRPNELRGKDDRPAFLDTHRYQQPANQPASLLPSLLPIHLFFFFFHLFLNSESRFHPTAQASYRSSQPFHTQHQHKRKPRRHRQSSLAPPGTRSSCT
ncbi:hypothetical protein EX30DRAFT_138733 [Ascodesmis nigricans]|uniref:Uncharacterized protein n=1 Tax=Ascodesmis nigricans TaxID=341454 RepID=A0A4V3SJ58_9PEZI|nr:hypothetical protein EX30DRAFT_138733 [Ascodesmis nigricans]